MIYELQKTARRCSRYRVSAAHSGGAVWDNEHKRRNGVSAAERHAADAISRLDGSDRRVCAITASDPRSGCGGSPCALAAAQEGLYLTEKSIVIWIVNSEWVRTAKARLSNLANGGHMPGHLAIRSVRSR